MTTRRDNYFIDTSAVTEEAGGEDSMVISRAASPDPVRDAYQTTRVHYAELRVRLTATKVEVSKVSSVNVEYDSP
ncbi:uncharacterized protein H6S33_007190 [Morchella sextelata]|uniref:uncharacterized protein n=1 Tax=Morchella sextelata TaxID=1174677 RepID=UPI001D044577|nr:uncharacterized protein H6S33_007190 [Morchella sextelata]KAH0604159.1 hypothetical protein H6S33_007190 [Morchella sextelata]